MRSRYPHLYRTLYWVALGFIVVGAFFPDWGGAWAAWPAAALIILLGIPHGATDHLIFQQIIRKHHIEGRGRQLLFFVAYLSLIGIYALLWWLMPVIALSLFLLLSVYHFGQSNWAYLEDLPRGIAIGLYLIWGLFVLAAPILWHYDAAGPIIASITGETPLALSGTLRYACVGGLFAMNGAAVLGLRFTGRLSGRQSGDELINLFLLAGLFWTTPLLVGFTVYFVGWHSATSIMDQVRFFRKADANYTLRDYAKSTLPLTVLSVAGLAALYGIALWLGMPLTIGLLFIFIAVITLPHMILIEMLYTEDTLEKSYIEQINAPSLSKLSSEK